jgi:hypothetical protein
MSAAGRTAAADNASGFGSVKGAGRACPRLAGGGAPRPTPGRFLAVGTLTTVVGTAP